MNTFQKLVQNRSTRPRSQKPFRRGALKRPTGFVKTVPTTNNSDRSSYENAFFDEFGLFIQPTNTVNRKAAETDLRKKIKFYHYQRTDRSVIALAEDPGRFTTFASRTFEKYACILYFQYIDILHDVEKTVGILATWDTFVEATTNIMGSAKFIKDLLFYAKKIHDGTQEPLTKFGRIFKSMLQLTAEPGRAGTERDIVLVKKRSDNNVPEFVKRREREIFLSAFETTLSEDKRYDVLKKRAIDVPRGAMGAGNVNSASKMNSGRGDGIVSTDMSNKCLVRMFTGNYTKYLHISNLGDPGIVFLSDIDIRYIIKSALKTSRGIQDTKFLNDRKVVIDDARNGDPLGTHNTQLLLDLRPLTIQIGQFKVRVSNEESTFSPQRKRNPVHGEYKDFSSFFNSKVNPVLLFGNSKKSVSFLSAKDATGFHKQKNRGEQYLYLMRKHLGDFFNVTNSVYNDVIFASGDSLACLGYLIAYHLSETLRDGRKPGGRPKPPKLMWEDATDQSIVYYGHNKNITANNHFKNITRSMLSRPLVTPLPEKNVFEAGTLKGEYEEIWKNLTDIANLPKLPNNGNSTRNVVTRTPVRNNPPAQILNNLNKNGVPNMTRTDFQKNGNKTRKRTLNNMLNINEARVLKRVRPQNPANNFEIGSLINAPRVQRRPVSK